MPFTRHVGVITRVAQQFSNCDDVFSEITLVTGLALLVCCGDFVVTTHAGAVRIDPGHHGSPCRTAVWGYMELRQHHALGKPERRCSGSRFPTRRRRRPNNPYHRLRSAKCWGARSVTESPSGAAVSRLQADPVSANNKQIIFRTRKFITSITGKLLPTKLRFLLAQWSLGLGKSNKAPPKRGRIKKYRAATPPNHRHSCYRRFHVRGIPRYRMACSPYRL